MKVRYENRSNNGGGGSGGEATLKDMMNVPIIPQMLRSLDEGIEMVAGYNEALDQVIDFIAGLNSDASVGNDEEGTVGKTIESGLLHLLGKVDVPNQFYDMKKKAGIFLQN